MSAAFPASSDESNPVAAAARAARYSRSWSSGGAPCALFVPTRFELEALTDLGGFDAGTCIAKTCGFGPVAAAAATAAVLATLRPARAFLVGIAGAYDLGVAPIGSALEFDAVAIDGVGAGEGNHFSSPAALGFAQWNGLDGEPAIFDRIVLRETVGQPRLLLTVCSASDGAAMAGERRLRFPLARAEDMEGFGVALSCALAGVPLRIVRGISNAAGDRDRRSWRVREALAAALELARSIAGDESSEGVP
jgi:futalosine hydrolase